MRGDDSTRRARAPGRVEGLGSSTHRDADGLGQLYSDKPLGGEEVVLSTFIDNADVTRRLRLGIRERHVDLVPFERRLVTLIVHTDDEACALWETGRRPT